MVGTLTYWHVWGNKLDPNFQKRYLLVDSLMLVQKRVHDNFSYITRSWKNCLPYCNLPHPLVKHMSSVSSKLRKLLEVGKQAGWTLILNFKGLPSFRITKSFSNVLLMNFIPSSTFQTICAMSLVWEKILYNRYVRFVKPRQQYPSIWKALW